MKGVYDKENITSCPIAGVQKVIQGKWAMVVVYYLSQGTFRFGELSRKMPQVTQANLTKDLRMLEGYGLVHREVYRQVPPKVEYSLTAIGRKFLPVMEALEIWAIEYEQFKKSDSCAEKSE